MIYFNNDGVLEIQHTLVI